MAAPSMTFGAAGNALASTSIVHATSSTTFNVDVSNKFEGQVMITCTFGTVAATAGLQIQIFEGYGSVPTYPTTNPNFTYTITAVGSTNQQSPKIALPTGKWQVRLTNLDQTNDITLCIGTLDTVDGIV